MTEIQTRPWDAADYLETDAPRQTEPSVNNALGGLLQGMLPGREVRAEHTRALAEGRGLQA